MPQLKCKPHCPLCDAVLDGATALTDPDAVPASGDITVCVYCEIILKFQVGDEDKVTLQVMDQDELNNLPMEMQWELANALMAIREMKNNNVFTGRAMTD